MEVLESHGAPMGLEDLVAELGVRQARDRESLQRRLVAMERDGQIIHNRQGAYGSVRRMDLVRGRVSAHRDGFGFLRPEDGGDDLFLSSRQMRALMHGDRIVARVSGVDRQGRREGAVAAGALGQRRADCRGRDCADPRGLRFG